MPTIRTRGKLPHWEADKAIYFVTFRLADSLPQSVLHAFEFERQHLLKTARQMDRALSLAEEDRLEKLYDERIQKKLDAGAGRCFLAKPEIAELVTGVFRIFELSRYRMYAWCVMPNHVHALFRLLDGYTLAGVLHAWKSFSANRANRILKRSGAFWQREYYDHLVRSEEECHRIVAYIVENPRRAGLLDWRWVGVSLKQ